ncbi:hypothetical protein WM06_34160 [Burkholderia cepacia]|uniref:hypothetical protein n=1 Tax=Burkholderia cepacia TaxID=292 RepID=UPI00075D4544|nr:hypothetical protein [Burkholderia cepacia]KWI58846.1 hypothetical protein WM06_34160 [Burkholderia cepacia]
MRKRLWPFGEEGETGILTGRAALAVEYARSRSTRTVCAKAQRHLSAGLPQLHTEGEQEQ